jgi:hypothetical protein
MHTLLMLTILQLQRSARLIFRLFSRGRVNVRYTIGSTVFLCRSYYREDCLARAECYLPSMKRR